MAYFAGLGASALVVSSFAESAEPPDADPHVRWCGRGGGVTRPPMPIVAKPSKTRLIFAWNKTEMTTA